ncbi:MAG: C2H2-type zinc finger protein [archaeon]|nr:C2H2-type zinc finger protein [archaeon]
MINIFGSHKNSEDSLIEVKIQNSSSNCLNNGSAFKPYTHDGNSLPVLYHSFANPIFFRPVEVLPENNFPYQIAPTPIRNFSHSYSFDKYMLNTPNSDKHSIYSKLQGTPMTMDDSAKKNYSEDKENIRINNSPNSIKTLFERFGKGKGKQLGKVNSNLFDSMLRKNPKQNLRYFPLNVNPGYHKTHSEILRNFSNPSYSGFRTFEVDFPQKETPPSPVTNVTNIYTNIIFNYENPKTPKKNFLQKKRNLEKKKEDSESSKEEENFLNSQDSPNSERDSQILSQSSNGSKKKIDKTTVTLRLNEIAVENISLSKFPVVSLPEEDLTVKLYKRIFDNENIFQMVEKYRTTEAVLDEKQFLDKAYLKSFTKEKQKLSPSLFLVGSNVKEENPIQIIKNFYFQIKTTVLTIQKNFIGKRKGALNEEQCQILKKLIISCNLLTDILTDFKKVGIKKKNPYFGITRQDKSNSTTVVKPKKVMHFKSYLCPYCNKPFEKGQGLGGHMSRLHPGQSEKYKIKMRIRNNREDQRKMLFDLKKKYYQMHNPEDKRDEEDSNFKYIVQKFVLSNKIDFRQFKKQERAKEKPVLKKGKNEEKSEELSLEKEEDSESENDKENINWNTINSGKYLKK